MAEYKLVGDFFGLKGTIYACLQCGVAIADRELHTDWHDNG